MSDEQFHDARLAALYDRLYPPERRADFRFYLTLVLAARRVLDVGCGTGALLRLARDAGHRGRLVGLDPAAGMLTVARQRGDVEWVQGDLTTVAWERAFDLVVMTGHAFQELLTDAEIRTALAAMRAALTADGLLAFETRNPADRAWERWAADYSSEVTDADGNLVRCAYRVRLPVTGDLVHSTSTWTSRAWPHPETSDGALRFIDAATLASFLTDAGLTIERQYGNWDRSPLTPASPEIITLARRG